MDINLILANVFAVIAWSLLAISYWKNKDDGILYLQILSSIFFILNYIFLQAYVGLFVIVFEIFRDYLYIKFDDDKKTFMLSLPVYALIGIFGFDGLWSLFSVFASVNDGYSLIYRGKKVVFLGILTYVLWLIYDLRYYSFVNAFADIVIILSNCLILFTNRGKFNDN